MKWNIDKSCPICPQIYENICVAVANGELLPKSKLFSVRELALQIGVNPNTVQKSFALLENDGIVYSIPGSGWYVSENNDAAITVVSSLREKKSDYYFQEMNHLGYSTVEIIKYINERYGDKNV